MAITVREISGFSTVAIDGYNAEQIAFMDAHAADYMGAHTGLQDLIADYREELNELSN